MRGIVEPFSNLISNNILRLRRGTLLSRYMRIILAFYISGLLHVCIDVALGIRFWDSGSPRFFVMQALGITVEDAVQEIYQRNGGKSNAYSRGLGYAWVSLWMVWTTPSWQWVLARATVPRDEKSIPYSFLGHLRRSSRDRSL